MNKTADTLPKFTQTVAETKTQPCITLVESRSGVVISFMCARKGGYEDLTAVGMCESCRCGASWLGCSDSCLSRAWWLILFANRQMFFITPTFRHW